MLARRVGGADLLRLRSQSRVLPAAAIREELETRVEEFRQRMQEPPGTREKRRMKAEARDELLPKALLKSDRTWGYVDLKNSILGIDSAQNAAAERFVRRLQAAIDGFNANPLQFSRPADEFLTKVFFDDAPAQFSLGRECRMQDPGDPRSVVRWTDFDLEDQAIRNHVANGMQLTHVAIVYDNLLSCVMDNNGALSKIRFVGDEDDGGEYSDPLARLDAEFVLVTGTLRRLHGDLKKTLGGYR